MRKEGENLVVEELEKRVENPNEVEGDNVGESEVQKLVENLIENEYEISVEDSIEDLVQNEAEVTEERAEAGEEALPGNEEEILMTEITEESMDTTEELVEGITEEPIKSNKKIIMGIAISFCIVLFFYFGMTIYFINHFYFGTEINGRNVSGKSVHKVEVLMESELESYTLSLKERGGKNEQIKAADVGLTYNLDEELKKLKDSQNPFHWVFGCFDRKDSKKTIEVTYNETLLEERMERLACLDSSNIIEPKNPSFQYVEGTYVIIDEILGNKIDKDVLYAHIVDALLKKEAEIDLELIDCYIQPKYNSKSQKIIEAKDILNQYVASKITYIFGSDKEVVEGSIINQWLLIGENFEVIVQEKLVEEYINLLSQKYDIVGRTRNFTTSFGETIQIGGGDFIRLINKEKETQNLIADIKEGKVITKEPIYDQMVVSYGNSDIGNTYVEINLTKQHIWFYKNSTLIVEGDIVTGNVRAGYTTPKGVYRLKSKAKNVILRGPGYAAPVTYWMPFNGGIGIHDANWRGAFGGEIYKTNGSHGCINCPYNVAGEIYKYIEPGTPVICY